ncbi:MAG TPA: AAA family ATPase, partial [Actinomycetota bacterium]|nr:AAA family ATPase [Actinomycetota bacterium]
MRERNRSTPAALLEGSQLVRKGGADVFRQRERTRLKKVARAVVVVFLFDYLLYRWLVAHPDGFEFQLPADTIFFLPALVIVLAIVLMISLPLISGRSPHVLVHPEQVEVGLSDIRGLDHQVDEVIRSLDVFLGYATFREELGGTPRRGILFEGPPGTGKTYLAKAMAKQAGVPFLFTSAPAFQSRWMGMTGARIRSFFKQLRKLARKEGGAIGFIEEIDAIGGARDSLAASPDGTGLGRVASNFVGPGASGMVNELLIQMQSFDQPPWR